MESKLNIKVGLVALSFLIGGIAHAQNTVTIGSEVLNDKAVLTLLTPTGDQGFILPVVENKENINPSASEKGMLVYENVSSEVYLWNGSQWINIVNGGNVDIGLMNDLEDVNTEGVAEGDVLKWTDGAWTPGPDETGSGDALWSAKDDNIHYSSGRVGVGTADPINALHIMADAPFPVRVESVTGPDSGIEFANHLGLKGYVGNVGLGGDMAIGTVDGNTEGGLLFFTQDLLRMRMNPDGNLGIGMVNPDAKLHIRSSETEAMRIENALDEVRLGFYNSSGYVGYVGSIFQSNLDFGTPSGNTTGTIRLKTQNLTRLAVDPDGNVGIGVPSPGVQLDVKGGQWDVTNTEGDFRIGNYVNRLKMGVATGGGGAGIARIRAAGNVNQLRLGAGSNDVIIVEEEEVEINGKVTRPGTGESDMIPLAYGFVTAGGTIGNGSGNWSVIRVSEGVYNITITDETFAASTHIAIVSKIGATGGIGWDSSSGNLRVISVNSSNAVSDVNFSFVVYKP